MRTEDLHEEIVELRKVVASSDAGEPVSTGESQDESADRAKTPDGVPPEDGAGTAAKRSDGALIGLSIAALLAVIAVGVWGYLFFSVRPDDNALAPDKQQVAVDRAAEATTALLSYKSDTVDADLAAASEYVTGTFADYYRTFTRDVVVPGAKARQLATQATVTAAGITEYSADRAVVLVFANQVSTTADIPNPTTTSTVIQIELLRDGGEWLVNKFDPL